MSSNPRQSEHEADEAGGEAIYSSEGLAPLSIPPPPLSQNVPDEEESFVDTSSSVSPHQAFQVFSGKVYTRDEAEDPLDKLARLRAEVTELETELKNEKNEKEAEEMAKELTVRLKALDGGMHSSLLGRADLASLVRGQVREVESEAAEDGEAAKGGIVYELYSDSAPVSKEGALEERLARLEGLLGSTCKGKVPMLQRLEEVEGRVRSIDEEVLKTASARAKVIRADLEAAAKAKTKLSNTTATTHTEDSKIIAKLHQQLMDLDGFLLSPSSSPGTLLGEIVDRLSGCADLHARSRDFGDGLTELEKDVADVKRMVLALDLALKNVEEGMVVNSEVVVENVRALEGRISDLGLE